MEGKLMNNYKIVIQYDGGRYKGWQRLGNGENTIQEKLEKILFEQFGKNIEIIGTSRTDAGVHALAQVANFKMEEEKSPGEIKKIFNRYLPEDISVKDVSLVDERFHARYNAKSKSYVYKIWNKDYTNPFIRKYSMQVGESLNLEKMKRAAATFVGEHDFTGFSTATSKKKSMVRTIDSIEITKEDDLIQIRIKGDSFLYNMVRRVVGMLIEIGLGNMEVGSVLQIFESKERKATGLIAEAKGLFLEKIEY